jgi:hypothetical protein
MATGDLNEVTRKMWLSTVFKQVYMRFPLWNKLVTRRQMKFPGGTALKFTMDTDDIEDLAQDYSPHEGLNGGSKNFLKTAYFPWGYSNIPLVYGVEEELQSGSDTVLNPNGDVVKMMVAKGQEAVRRRAAKWAYGLPRYDSSGDSAAGETGVFHKGCLSLADALTEDIPYGRDSDGALLTRSSSTNTWYQPAVPFSDQTTAKTASIKNFRTALNSIMKYANGPMDLMCITSPDNFDALRAQIEARGYMPEIDGDLAKYGFETIKIDNVPIVKDHFLAEDLWDGGTSGTYTNRFMYILNLATWQIRMHPKRSWEQTPFKWQGDVAGGADEWLGRLLFAGQCVCTNPNANFMHYNIQP